MDRRTSDDYSQSENSDTRQIAGRAGHRLPSGKKIGLCISVAITALAVVAGAYFLIRRDIDARRLAEQQEHLAQMRTASPERYLDISFPETPVPSAEPEPVEYTLLPEYQAMYAENSDLIGWLRIDGTVIDYPVMQTPEDEDYYVTRGFDRQPNSNGCLIMDTDAVVGVGTAAYDYRDGVAPSTNLIIHGHTMKSGAMFGDLQDYARADYAAEHSVICFDSLYEHRRYEVVAAFYSQIYYTYEDVFKFYKFFQADTPEEFADWYDNIKALSIYDTGVTAAFGDEFITLTCCSYQVEDGRFVVVGKRVE